MTNAEAPFTATLPLEVHGCRVLLTARGDTQHDLQVRWAELAENAGTLVESFNLIIGAANAAPMAQHAPTPAAPQPAAPTAGGWNTPPQPAQQATPDAPMCNHGMPRKFVPAGVSKKTNNPYPAFWACTNPDRNNQCNSLSVN